MATVHPESAREVSVSGSPRWRALADRALPLRYPLLILLFVLVVMTGQFIEDALDTPTLEMLTPSISIPRWTLVLLIVYILLVLMFIQRTAARTARDVRPAVLCDDATYEQIASRLRRVHWRTDLGLAAISFALVMFLFPVLQSPLPVTRHPQTDALTFLPQDPLNAAVVIVAYSLVGWAGLSLLTNTVRLGRALGALTKQPLIINLYNTENLVPFGDLALMLSLAAAGVILILLVGLGTPTGMISWFAFLLASAASVLALALPLRGVHRQMDSAKKRILGELNQELAFVQAELLNTDAPDGTRTAYLSNRTSTLVQLRQVVGQMPTWPFRDTVALSRAILVASAPIIYTVVNELIRIVIIAPLTR